MPADTAPRFCLAHYDVPSNKAKQFAAYGAIRKVLRGKSVMLSRSCYLIPIALRTNLNRALQQVEDDGSFGLRWGIAAFDASENKKTQREVVLSLQRMISGALASYRRSCAKVRVLLNKGETTIEDLSNRTYAAEMVAKRALEDAVAAATAFEETGSIDDIFRATTKAFHAEVVAEEAWERNQGSIRERRSRKAKDAPTEAGGELAVL